MHVLAAGDSDCARGRCGTRLLSASIISARASLAQTQADLRRRRSDQGQPSPATGRQVIVARVVSSAIRGVRRCVCVCGVSARSRSTFLKPAAAPSASAAAAAAALLRVVDLAVQCYADDRKLRQLSPAAVSCSDSGGRTDPWRWLSPTRRRRNDCPRPLPVRRRRWTWSLRRPPECSSC